MIMKKILLTLVALMAFAFNMQAQNRATIKYEKFHQYGWGSGSEQCYNVYQNGKHAGELLIKVNADKTVTFTAKTSCTVGIDCVVAWRRQGNWGGQRVEKYISAGQTYNFTGMLTYPKPFERLAVHDFKLK